MADVFKNPSRKEMMEAQKKGDGEFRGFIMENGYFYIISGAAFHEETRKEVLHGNKNNIAMYGEITGNKILIKISTSMKDRKEQYGGLEGMTKMIENNKQLQRNFNNIHIWNKYWG